MEFLLSNTGWKVGSNSEANIWNTKWVNGQIPKPLIEPPLGFLVPIRHIRELFQQPGNWNKQLIECLFNNEWQRNIYAIPLCHTRVNDEIYWTKTTSGKYTVKSGYGVALQILQDSINTQKDKSRIGNIERSFCKKSLWNLHMPHNWKVLLWKIITNAMPMGYEFSRRGINADNHCPLCKDITKIETLEHLFRDCHFVNRIWSSSILGIRSSSNDHLKLGIWIINWVMYLYNQESANDLIITFVAILRSIWQMRNNCIFRGVNPSPLAVMHIYMDDAKIASKAFCLNGHQSFISDSSTLLINLEALKKFRLGKNQQSEICKDVKQETVDSEENCSINELNLFNEGNEVVNEMTEDQTQENAHIAQALQIQMEVQRKLHQQIEVQRHLQLRIEAQGKYLQKVLKKAHETLSGYNNNCSSIGVEHAKAELSQLVSMVSSSSFSELTETTDLSLDNNNNNRSQKRTIRRTGCSVESSLTSSESSERPDEERDTAKKYSQEIGLIGPSDPSSSKRGRSISCEGNFVQEKYRKKMKEGCIDELGPRLGKFDVLETFDLNNSQ
ncbi:hypothetical protein KSS87_003831 [Heliosperma pusillum]|nr:hypothetical protein KSS87_003831 [Heliosperma pusillum]